MPLLTTRELAMWEDLQNAGAKGALRMHEKSFIESISVRNLEENPSLTDRQYCWFSDIWQRLPARLKYVSKIDSKSELDNDIPF